MHGLLIIDKPEGITSAEVVRRVKRRLHQKVGHLGTLDPFASGVLPLCIGDGTKIAQFLNTADKEYTGVIRLGSQTDTGDRTGAVTATAPVPQLAAGQLEGVAARFCGDQLQTPPMYSAIKKQGTPLYKLARQGIAVAREPRTILITCLALRVHGGDAIEFDVACSKGTYVRVLAQEIAVAVGSVGHLEALRRTRFGRFRVEEALSIDAVGLTQAPVIGLREALAHMREIRIEAAAVRRARHGYGPLLEGIQRDTCEGAAKLVGPDGQLVAVIVVDQLGRWRFGRVVGEAEAGASE